MLTMSFLMRTLSPFLPWLILLIYHTTDWLTVKAINLITYFYICLPSHSDENYEIMSHLWEKHKKLHNHVFQQFCHFIFKALEVSNAVFLIVKLLQKYTMSLFSLCVSYCFARLFQTKTKKKCESHSRCSWAHHGALTHIWHLHGHYGNPWTVIEEIWMA